MFKFVFFWVRKCNKNKDTVLEHEKLSEKGDEQSMEKKYPLKFSKNHFRKGPYITDMELIYRDKYDPSHIYNSNSYHPHSALYVLYRWYNFSHACMNCYKLCNSCRYYCLKNEFLFTWNNFSKYYKWTS